MHLKTLNLLKQNPKWVQIMDWSILLEFPSPYPQKVMKKKDDDLFKKFVVILKKFHEYSIYLCSIAHIKVLNNYEKFALKEEGG